MVTFTATPANGGSPSFQWYVNGFPVGTNQPVFSYFPSNGDQVNVIMTSSMSCVSPNPATSNTVFMIVNSQLQVSVSITEDQNNVCEGTAVIFTATPVNGGTPTYQWYKNNMPSGVNQPVYTFVPVSGDQVYVVITSSLLCVSGNPAMSNIVNMVVNAPLPASVSITPDQNNICEGTAVTYTAMAYNGGTPSFQWYVNGVAVGANQPGYSCFPVNGDLVNVKMTSSLSCVSGNPSTSNTIAMVVNAPLPVSVSVVADHISICQGASVSFTAITSNGGVPVYQWYLNNQQVGINQPVYTCVPANGDEIYVVSTSSEACVSGSPATSNTIAMEVKPVLPFSVTIVSDQNKICQGNSNTLTATSTNGGTPVYQWYLNGVASGTGQSAYTFIPNNGDKVYLIATSGELCVSGNPATSNLEIMQVGSMAGNAGAINGPSSVCAGTEGAVFSVAPVPDALSYLWTLPAGVNIVSGANSEQITVDFNNDAAPGDITVLASNDCGSGENSPVFHVTVSPVPATPVVDLQWPDLHSSISEGNQWYCQDTLITGATGQTYSASKSGWYWTVITTSGCSSDSSNHVYVDATDPGTVVPGILVYPVPNDGHFTISIIVLSPETFDIFIYNQLGQNVYEIRDLLVSNKFKKVVDLRPKAKGVYSVVFKGFDYQVVKKILINN